jgi:hypothetical protein
MFIYKDPDIFSLPVCGTVIPTNTAGVAGAGLAKQARDLDPEWYEHYRAMCLSGRHHLGEPILHKPTNYRDGTTRFISFPTKGDPWDRVNLGNITAGLSSLASYLMDMPDVLQSIAIPPLGCGCGNYGIGNGYVTKAMVEKHIITSMKPLAKKMNIYMVDFSSGGMSDRARAALLDGL